MKIKIAVSALLLILSFFQLADACTTFIISGKYTSDGKPILFKNRDADDMNNALVRFNDGKYEYIGLVNADKDANTMVWGGFNRTGFAIINSAAYNNNLGDTTSLLDQEGVLMKLALQTCRTLEDFENLLKTLPKPLGVDANFGVIDANGGAAYYETGNFRFVKYDVNDPKIAPEGFLVRTNHSMSGDLNKGFGFVRYSTAMTAMKEAAMSHQLSPQYLFNHISRNLTHSLTHTNLWENKPKDNSSVDYRFFVDFIPRTSTAAAIMIVGAPDEKLANKTIMWTILGFPLTSVAIPCWIPGSKELPKAVSINGNMHAPLCDLALKLKAQCFPITRDKGQAYINLAMVLNDEKSGIMQKLQPVEEKIFTKANELVSNWDASPNPGQDIKDYYSWLDSYLEGSYKKLFALKLF